MEDFQIPSSKSTYRIKVFKLNDMTRRRHLVEIEPRISNKKLVHHMFVFHCEAKVDVEFPMLQQNAPEWPEELKTCRKIVAFWVSVDF